MWALSLWSEQEYPFQNSDMGSCDQTVKAEMTFSIGEPQAEDMQICEMFKSRFSPSCKHGSVSCPNKVGLSNYDILIL